MKKMVRILALALSLVLMLGLLAACGGGAAPAPQGGTPAAPQGGAAAPQQGGTPAAPPADNTEYKLVFAGHGTTSHAYAGAIVRWRDALYEESGGRLNIELHWGATLASATDEVGLVQQGGADLTWCTNSLNPSLFRYPGIIGAYGEQVTNTFIGTYTMIEMLRNCEAVSSEFTKAGLKVLAYHTQTPSSLGGKGNRVEKPDDYKGVSVQSISKNCIGILDSFGAAVIGVSVPDLYENFSKNVCSAAMVDSALFSETRLYEEIDWFNTFNYNSSVGFMAMNQQKFDSLPADLQQLLESKFDELSYGIAEDTNNYFIKFVDETLPANNVAVYNTSPEMIAAINEKFQSVIVDPYRAMCKEDGYDADEIMSQMQKALTEARAKYGAEYDWFANVK